MKSVERLSNEKTPASRSEWPRARRDHRREDDVVRADRDDAGGETRERPAEVVVGNEPVRAQQQRAAPHVARLPSV